jgi:uncharacterized membrane protein YfcA
MHDLAFIFADFAVGLIVGFGIKPHLAIGTDLLFAAFTKMGSIPAALVRLTSVGASAMGSLPGIWLGSQLVHQTPDRIIRSLLSLLLAYAGVKLITI